MPAFGAVVTDVHAVSRAHGDIGNTSMKEQWVEKHTLSGRTANCSWGCGTHGGWKFRVEVTLPLGEEVVLEAKIVRTFDELDGVPGICAIE
ncbi:uncharacterized protein METZ01_LOCUS290263, partial [marine metagenome]